MFPTELTTRLKYRFYNKNNWYYNDSAKEVRTSWEDANDTFENTVEWVRNKLKMFKPGTYDPTNAQIVQFFYNGDTIFAIGNITDISRDGTIRLCKCEEYAPKLPGYQIVDDSEED